MPFILSKIANDLRWLTSRLRAVSTGEIELSDLQPGSSITGKINTLPCGRWAIVAGDWQHVIGCDATIALCGGLRLNTMMPVMALRILESISFSAAVMQVFTDKCIKACKRAEDELVDPWRSQQLSSQQSAMTRPQAFKTGRRCCKYVVSVQSSRKMY